MSTATVTKRLKAEGLPVEMVRGKGYHYFIFDDGERYESHSVWEMHFGGRTTDEWVNVGRQLAAMIEAGTYDRLNTYL